MRALHRRARYYGNIKPNAKVPKTVAFDPNYPNLINCKIKQALALIFTNFFFHKISEILLC